VCAGGGDDTVAAGGGNDEVDLGAGGDSVAPGSGDDFLNGAKGFDVVVYDTTNDIRADLRIGVINGMGRDRVMNISAIITGAGNDVLIGTDRHDDFVSNAGDDTLIGLRGNDLLGPGTGDDQVRGGRGGDQVDYFFSDDFAPVQIDLAAGTVMGQGLDTLRSIEGAGGTNSDDTLSGNAESPPAPPRSEPHRWTPAPARTATARGGPWSRARKRRASRLRRSRGTGVLRP